MKAGSREPTPAWEVWEPAGYLGEVLVSVFSDLWNHDRPPVLEAGGELKKRRERVLGMNLMADFVLTMSAAPTHTCLSVGVGGGSKSEITALWSP